MEFLITTQILYLIWPIKKTQAKWLGISWFVQNGILVKLDKGLKGPIKWFFLLIL
jgi:hypothetical protein